MRLQNEMKTFRPISYRMERAQAARKQSRKFNLKLGLKRCFDDFNDYMGIETTSDKIFYHTYFWATVVMLVITIKVYAEIVGF